MGGWNMEWVEDGVGVWVEDGVDVWGNCRQHFVILSVSVRVQKEDVCLHPYLEFWMYTHC